VKFLVDGKQSGLIGNDPATSLQQIPASSIERIEIIDNPSAKFEPEGMSGIINIIMKKSEESGYNANVSFNAGTSDKYNTSLNFNLKKNKFNLFGSLNLRLFNMDENSQINRINNFSDTLYSFAQTSGQHMKMQGQMGTIGFDYNINNKNSLSLTGTYNKRSRASDENINFKDIDANGNFISQYDRKNSGNHHGEGFDLTLNYNHKFDMQRENLSSTVFFSNSNDNQSLNITQQNYTAEGGLLGNPIMQNTYTNGSFNLSSLQIDYYLPIGHKNGDSRYELGYKGTIRNTSSDFKSESLYVFKTFWTTQA